MQVGRWEGMDHTGAGGNVWVMEMPTVPTWCHFPAGLKGKPTRQDPRDVQVMAVRELSEVQGGGWESGRLGKARSRVAARSGDDTG